MALVYGFLFPIIFLAAFWALYRHEQVPLLLHMGELLTVTILGGACFGLPTTLVSERERGVWQRYRLTPMRTGTLVLSTLLARYVIIAVAGLLQLAIALAIGMTPPADPIGLTLAFTFVTFAFIAIGLVIAALADSVPAVQALGQCIFLPMLILGGVAVPIGSLPEWAQQLSAFLPGRYAVESLQHTINAESPASAQFNLLALALIGVGALLGGTKLFRWAAGQRFRSLSGKAWLIPAVLAWVLVGVLAETRSRSETDTTSADSSANQREKARRPDATRPPTSQAPTAAIAPPAPSQPWELLTEADIDALDFTVPPDDGLVTPIAGQGEMPDDETDLMLAKLEGELPHWAPGQVEDPVQRVRNLLCVASVLDLLQNPVERFVPSLVQQRMELGFPPEKLVRLLAWIALHPEEGSVITDLSDLHIEGVVSETVTRERVRLYAIKLIARITGRKTMKR
jgi:ABC-2 type transport system permease protein